MTQSASTAMRLTQVKPASIHSRAVTVFVAEDTAVSPALRGNKRFKLVDNLKRAKSEGYAGVVGVGGAYSNFIHALALLAREQKLKSVGIIRGESIAADNATLSDACRWGMQIHCVSRAEYQRRHDRAWIDRWRLQYPSLMFLPEGGSNLHAVRACQYILDGLDNALLSQVTHVVCALGTGATACGLSLALNDSQRLRGYSVVADTSRQARMNHWLQQCRHSPIMEIIKADQPKFGKVDQALCEYIDNFFQQFQILLDPLYMGKLMRQLELDIQNNEFPDGSVVLVLHTGGLQGWRGFLTRFGSTLHSTTLNEIHQQTRFSEIG